MKINDKHLVAYVNSNAPIDKEGYLHKKGELNKAYQRRWFVLKGNLLFYFERRGDREPIGVIVLESCTVELGDDTDKYSFDVVFQGHGSRTYSLAAETQEEMELWMKSITCAGYDYMKLMVNELQRQLDDLNTVKAEQVRLSRQSNARSGGGVSSTASSGSVSAAFPTRTELTQSVLRQSSQSANSLLVDVPVPSSNRPSVKQTKRIGRINPFDSNAPPNATSSSVAGGFSSSNPFAASAAIEEGVDALDLNSRHFRQMHAQFGDYIKQKCKIVITGDEPLM